MTTLGEIAEHVAGVLHGEATREVTGVAGIDDARNGDVTFLANDRYRSRISTCQATAVLVPKGVEISEEIASIEVENPSLAFSQVISLFHQEVSAPSPGVHPQSCVDSTANLGEDVSISAFAVVEAGASIGDRTILYPGVYVGIDSKIGEDCVLYSGAFLGSRVLLGNRVILQPHAVVGSDGFGYVEVNGFPVKVPQTGIVEVADDVEIGAGSTIDRARFERTRLARGAKIDNLVQIAHNVSIGEGTCIAAQTGIAGSTSIGRGVLIGGQVGIVGHLSIHDGARIAAQTGVSRDVSEGAVVAGTPAMPARQYWKMIAMMRKLPSIIQELNELRAKVLRLEGNAADDSETG